MHKACCALPLTLRHKVAAAWTAALMQLYVGWQNNKNTYGKVLVDFEEAETLIATLDYLF